MSDPTIEERPKNTDLDQNAPSQDEIDQQMAFYDEQEMIDDSEPPVLEGEIVDEEFETTYIHGEHPRTINNEPTSDDMKALDAEIPEAEEIDETGLVPVEPSNESTELVVQDSELFKQVEDNAGDIVPVDGNNLESTSPEAGEIVTTSTQNSNASDQAASQENEKEADDVEQKEQEKPQMNSPDALSALMGAASGLGASVLNAARGGINALGALNKGETNIENGISINQSQLTPEALKQREFEINLGEKEALQEKFFDQLNEIKQMSEQGLDVSLKIEALDNTAKELGEINSELSRMKPDATVEMAQKFEEQTEQFNQKVDKFKELLGEGQEKMKETIEQAMKSINEMMEKISVALSRSR